MSIVFQLFGIAGGAFGLYGFYTGNMLFMTIGVIIAFLFCREGYGSMVEMISTRIFIAPVLSLIGMLICHFALKMAWGIGFLISFNWILTVLSLIYLIILIMDRS